MKQTINEKIIAMKQDIHYIKEALEKMPTIEGMKLANQKLVEEIFEKSEKRYASKTIEKIVWGTAGIVGTAILYSLLGLVIK